MVALVNTAPGQLGTDSKEAQAIWAEHQEIQQAGKALLHRAKEVGDRLLARKQALPHGEWGAWLAQYLPEMSQRHVGNYLRVASEWDKLGSYLEQGEPEALSLRGAIAYLAETAKSELPTEAEVVQAWSAVGRVAKRKGRFPYTVEPHGDLSTYGFPKSYGNLKSLWTDWLESGSIYQFAIAKTTTSAATAPAPMYSATVAPVPTDEGKDNGDSLLGLTGASEDAIVSDGSKQALAVGDRIVVIDSWEDGGVVADLDVANRMVAVAWDDSQSDCEEWIRAVDIYRPATNGSTVADLPTPKTVQQRMHQRLSTPAAKGDQPGSHDENNTPQWIWQPLLDRWNRGEFDIDVATNGASLVPAITGFTKDDSALTADRWAVEPTDDETETLGWDNCPYSMNEAFSLKFLEQHQAGTLPTHFFVLNKSDSRTHWHQRYLRHADAVCRITSYVKFENGEGDRAGATFSLDLFYFGPAPVKFAEATAHYGVVMFPAKIQGAYEKPAADQVVEVLGLPICKPDTSPEAIAEGLASGYLVPTVEDANGDRIKVGDVLIYRAGGIAGMVTGFTPRGRCECDKGGQTFYADGGVCVIDPVGLG